MIETNPTAAEFAALLAEVKVAERLCSDARGGIEEEAAGQRVMAATSAILSARPTDPGVMAAQLRFLVAGLGVNADARGALAHIAEQLEAFASGVLLSADAVQQIRAALLEVLQHSGGGMEPNDDPGPIAGNRALRPGVGASTARRDPAAPSGGGEGGLKVSGANRPGCAARAGSDHAPKGGSAHGYANL